MFPLPLSIFQWNVTANLGHFPIATVLGKIVKLQKMADNAKDFCYDVVNHTRAEPVIPDPSVGISQIATKIDEEDFPMSDSALNTAAFLDCIAPLLDSHQVQSMKRWRHHFSITCYEHSLFVSYMAFRLARFFGWDFRAAARAGLLHDLYLYDPADRSAHPGNQCLDHPVFALRNARALCADLSAQEENAILTHMWPLSIHLPRCREAAVVNLADKVCATIEVIRLYRTRRVQRWLPQPARI